MATICASIAVHSFIHSTAIEWRRPICTYKKQMGKRSTHSDGHTYSLVSEPDRQPTTNQLVVGPIPHHHRHIHLSMIRSNESGRRHPSNHRLSTIRLSLLAFIYGKTENKLPFGLSSPASISLVSFRGPSDDA